MQQTNYYEKEDPWVITTTSRRIRNTFLIHSNAWKLKYSSFSIENLPRLDVVPPSRWWAAGQWSPEEGGSSTPDASPCRSCCPVLWRWTGTALPRPWMEYNRIVRCPKRKKIKQMRYYRQCCRSKYIELVSGPRLVTKFGYGSMVRIWINLEKKI